MRSELRSAPQGSDQLLGTHEEWKDPEQHLGRHSLEGDILIRDRKMKGRKGQNDGKLESSETKDNKREDSATPCSQQHHLLKKMESGCSHNDESA